MIKIVDYGFYSVNSNYQIQICKCSRLGILYKGFYSSFLKLFAEIDIRICFIITVLSL
ncbi:hypothetical protein CIRMBP1197_01491 [Enterococcus cecorum]|nr:hypothetical protein CIRMBP1197_01491 [Enterococcus cecorum]